ncbi:MAG: hypothetical protein KF865_09965 [Bdellovibrionaceae bacterium]|nr:hypothetical protein [Pseudobdellovibrionaceae bacterium]
MKRVHFLVRALVSLSMVTGSLPSTAAAAGGVDGVEFQPIPVNINNRCSTMILKGTNKYKGYAFKMPKVMLSVDKNLEDLFEIIPRGNGQYTLRFGLYFPLKDDAVELNRERSNLVLNSCKDDIILAELNEMDQRQAAREGRKASERDGHGTIYQDKIVELSPLPVSAVEVSINGFQGMTKTVGVIDGNLLSYQNSDLVVDFAIPDEQTYEEIKSHLTGRIGLSVNIRMYFSARSTNGRVDIQLNTNNMARSLEAAANASLGLKDPTGLANIPIGDADLRAYLAKAMAESNVNLRTEEGDNEAFNRLSYQLIERIVSQVPALPQIPGSSWNPNSCINNPGGYGCNNGGGWGSSFPSTGTGWGGGTSGDPGSASNGTLMTPPPPSVGTPGPVLGKKTTPTPQPDPTGGWGLPGTTNPAPQPAPAPGSGNNGRFFYLGGVLNALRQMQNINLSWENMGKKETQSYTENVVVRGAIPDPGYKTLYAVADDTQGASYTGYIKAGQQIVLKIPSQRQLVTSYDKRVQYLSKDEIRRQGLTPYFGFLQEAVSKNLLQETIDRENGGYVAVYRYNQGSNAVSRWWKATWDGLDMTPWNFYWGEAELRRRTSMRPPMDLALSESDLSRLPLRVMFSELGTRFNMADLTKETARWSGRYEDDQIVLTAKRDLGFMTIRNYDKVEAPNRLVEKYLFEVKEPVVKTRDAAQSSLSSRRQYNWVKYSNGTDNGVEKVGEPDLTPFRITKSVYVVLVKVGEAGGAAQDSQQLQEIKTTITPKTDFSPVQRLH